MKNIYCSGLVLMMVLVVSGCAENKTRIAEGSVIGTLLGAGAGAIIGHQSGHGVEGALIGGATGAAGGALVGSQIEKEKPYDPRVSEPSSNVTMEKIVKWTQQGDSGDDIIARIKATHSTFSLTKDDITYLKTQGVSQRVIEAMQSS